MRKACIVFLAVTILGIPVGPAVLANVIGADDRVLITAAYTNMGMDTVDMLRIRQSTGFVYCPGTVHQNPARTSGAVINDNRVVVTNAHSFIDESGRPREPLDQCYFVSQGVVPEIRYFDFNAGFVHPEKWWANKYVNDWAVVRLKQPLMYGRAFPIAPASDLTEGRSFIMVSAKPRRVWAPFPMEEPVVQTCGVRKIFPASLEHKTVFYSDCDVSPGASGSVGLVSINGRLNAFSVVSGSGPTSMDGAPYSESTESHSFHTAYRDDLLTAILRLSK